MFENVRGFFPLQYSVGGESDICSGKTDYLLNVDAVIRLVVYSVTFKIGRWHDSLVRVVDNKVSADFIFSSLVSLIVLIAVNIGIVPIAVPLVATTYANYDAIIHVDREIKESFSYIQHYLNSESGFSKKERAAKIKEEILRVIWLSEMLTFVLPGTSSASRAKRAEKFLIEMASQFSFNHQPIAILREKELKTTHLLGIKYMDIKKAG